MTDMNNVQNADNAQYITEDDAKLVLEKYGYNLRKIKIEDIEVKQANDDKVLGFAADHIVLKISVISNNIKKVHSFFVKTVSMDNEAKAALTKDFNMFATELNFFKVIKNEIDIPGIPAWSPRFLANLGENILVFEDLMSMQYKMHNKHQKFDMNHIMEALKTLARFHSTSIIFEERMSEEQQRPYRIHEEYAQYLTEAYIQESNSWFSQSRLGALAAVKEFSKYAKDKNLMETIEERWSRVWNSSLRLSDPSSEQRNVIAHRDLWNNNILFHYKKLEDGSLVPDDCLLVDFQGVRCQPPAGDVMFLLHCNVEPQIRKARLNEFLEFYYNELTRILRDNEVDIQFVIPKDVFFKSANQQNLWGLIMHASIVQVFWLDDDLTMEIFSDADMFQKILREDRSTYIKAMIQKCEHYKHKMMETFEEFVDEHVLND